MKFNIGNNALKLPERKPQFRVITPNAEEVQVIYAKRKKVSILSTLLTLSSIMIILYMCINLIYMNTIIQTTRRDIANMEQNLRKERLILDEMRDNIDTSINLNKIYKKAKKMGMKEIIQENVYCYQNKKSNKTIQYSDVPES